MKIIETLRSCAMVGAVFMLAIGGTSYAQCVGDCDDNGKVTIDELIRGVNISLEKQGISVCSAMDGNGNDLVAINELIQAVNSSLNGCPEDCGDCNDGNACTTDVCANGECVNNPVVCQDDGNECTIEACDPVSGCVSSNVNDGVSCNGGAGSCQGGTCIAFECIDDGDCDDGNACTVNSCADNACVDAPVVCQDDGNECTVEACDPQSGCGSGKVGDLTSCDGGAKVCLNGVCASAAAIQYQQDFESLDRESSSALKDEGFLVFGNVFDGARYLYGYGAFPAPNGEPPGFSQIATGQGGPDQGEQQLSIYSDYNNQDHAKGYLIESNVFRERGITADDVGNTITFSFDAKRGNINDPADPLCPCTSMAFAFIKTLNPAANYATTNFVKEETTAIPETWGRYTLTLAIDAGLVNQRLQVGFYTNATLFQPSAVFYDNLLVSSLETMP